MESQDKGLKKNIVLNHDEYFKSNIIKSINFTPKLFKQPLYDDNKNQIEFTFELVNSDNRLIEDYTIDIKSKNVVFDSFMGLRNDINNLYFPIFLCLRSNIQNVYITHDKNLPVPVIYKLVKDFDNNSLCKMYKIHIKDFNKESIDTYIHSTLFFNEDKVIKKGYIKAKNIICFNFGNSKTFIQNQYFILPKLSDKYTIHKAIIPYNSDYLWSKVKKWNEKENYIIYPATITGPHDKNQVKFAKYVDSEIIKDYTIIFAGDQGKHGYDEEEKLKLINILKKKKINYMFPKCKTQEDFFDLLLKSKFLIFYGTNPVDRVRALTEGLYANLPFIINDVITTLPATYFNYGYKTKNNNKKHLNSNIKELINKDWGLEPYLFTKKNFQIDNISKEIIEQINKRVELEN